MWGTRWGKRVCKPKKKTRGSLFFFAERKKKKRGEAKKKSETLFNSCLVFSQMPLPSQSTRPGQRSRSMFLMPLAVAAARRATASCSSRATMMSSALALAPSSAAATLYSIMRRRPSPLRLHFPSPIAAGAIRRPFAASTSVIASPPRSNKRLSNRSPNQGQLGTPLKAAAGGGGGGGGGAAGDVAAASALPSHCSGCGVSLQGSDPNLPG